MNSTKTKLVYLQEMQIQFCSYTCINPNTAASSLAACCTLSPWPDLKLCLCCRNCCHVLQPREPRELMAREHRGEDEEEISWETWTGVVSLPLAFIKAANWHPRDPKPLDPPPDASFACSELSPLLCLSVSLTRSPSFSLVLSSLSWEGERGREGRRWIDEGGVF